MLDIVVYGDVAILRNWRLYAWLVIERLALVVVLICGVHIVVVCVDNVCYQV